VLKEAGYTCVGCGSFNAWFGRSPTDLTYYAEILPNAAKVSLTAVMRGAHVEPFDFDLGPRLNAGDPEPAWYRRRWRAWMRASDAPTTP
jgi:hypothetical protein